MNQCKDCVHFRYVNKGLEPNYSGCEKCSVTIGNPYKCTAYKRISLWSRIRGVFNMIKIWLYIKTKGKIDFGVGKKFKKFEDMLAANTSIK